MAESEQGMTNGKKPRPETRSITFKDVPTEYIEQLESLVGFFTASSMNPYTKSKITPNMSKAQLKTLWLCQLVHENGEDVMGVGSTKRALERHQRIRKMWNQDLSLDNK